MQVAELEKLVNGRRVGADLPDLASATASVREKVCDLQQVVTTEISKSGDRVSGV